MDKQHKNNTRKHTDAKDTNETNVKRNNELNGVSFTNFSKTPSKTSVINNKKHPASVPKSRKENRAQSRRNNITDLKETSENDNKIYGTGPSLKDNSFNKSGIKNGNEEIVKRNAKRKTVNKLMYGHQVLEDFHFLNVEQEYQQTKNERDALSNSTLFSNLEKRTLRLNNYSPVLVDTILLQKLTRLDQTSAKKLIFNVIEKTNNDIDTLSLQLSTNSNKDITIKTKRRSSIKKLSVKKFLISQIYNLLHSRLSRDKDRLAEILYYLLVKMCLKKNPPNFDDNNNGDIRRVRNKIKEYTTERNELIKQKLALREKYGGHNGDGKRKRKGKGRHDKSMKKQKSNKLNENSNQKLELIRGKVKMSKHDLMRMELLSVGKEQIESTIRDYLVKQTSLNDMVDGD